MSSVAFNYQCVKENGFIMDPNAHTRIGYVTNLDGFGLAGPLSQDLKVSLPYNGISAPTYADLTKVPGPDGGPDVSQVVGVIDKFEWEGAVGSSINIEFWCSKENATQIQSLQQQVLKTTKIKKLGWWIIDYDQEAKQWFEQAYPLSSPTITGLITGAPELGLDVNLDPEKVKDGIDVNVYKVIIKVAPAANLAYTLHFSNTPTKKVCKAWGLVVGTIAAAQF